MNTVLFLSIGIIALLPVILYVHYRPLIVTWRLIKLGLIVAAFIYLGFALVWGDGTWLGIELVGMVIYALFIPLSIRYGPYLLALGWLLHPIWDLGVHLYGPGRHIVPEWYALACVSFDVGMAVYIVYRHKRSR